MSLAGAMGGHSVVARLITMFGTDGQKKSWLPRLATGQARATMALTEPAGGSDLQAIRTRAAANGQGYRLDGVKTWITNARTAQVVAVLCKTDPEAVPGARGISIMAWRAARSSLTATSARARRCSAPRKARVSAR